LSGEKFNWLPSFADIQWMHENPRKPGIDERPIDECLPIICPLAM